MNTAMADGARERCVAQIGEAVFGQPGLTLMELAEKVKVIAAERAKADRQPGEHRWDDVGERCLDCGDKDWMGGKCNGPLQPSPAGQVDALNLLAGYLGAPANDLNMKHEITLSDARDAIAYALAARQPVGDDQHADSLAVDTFANAMKSKMTVSRWRGRSGWEDRSQCSQEQLSQMLRAHVEKGDPVDVANFCMMLSMRGEGIVPEQAVDLGQFQPAVDAMRDDAENWAYRDQRMAAVDRLQALIDSKAVGNG